MTKLRLFVSNQHNHSNHLSRQASSNRSQRQKVTRNVCHVRLCLHHLWPEPGSREDNTFHPKGRALGKPRARLRQTDAARASIREPELRRVKHFLRLKASDFRAPQGANG
jgi:hypothetical protein